jgi:adenylate cyclase class 2
MKSIGLEREIKLRCAGAGEARDAILALGATPVRGRRLQEDYLLDTADERIRRRRCVLRVRVEPGRSLLTFKGPVQPSPMKLREERETVVGDGEAMLRLFEALGFHVWFRYQKYREEFGHENVVVALDETPMGAFIELEGSEQEIADLAAKFGSTPAEYVLDSYRGLYVKHCEEHGIPIGDMLFDE